MNRIHRTIIETWHLPSDQVKKILSWITGDYWTKDRYDGAVYWTKKNAILPPKRQAVKDWKHPNDVWSRTPGAEDYLKSNYRDSTHEQLIKDLKDKFGLTVTWKQIRSKASDMRKNGHDISARLRGRLGGTGHCKDKPRQEVDKPKLTANDLLKMRW